MASDRDLSRALSHALRHDPVTYGLALDDDGWVGLSEVVQALRRNGFADVREEDIRRVVAGFEKQRHLIDHGRIRAAYGHSVSAGAQLSSEEPPHTLLHGTAPANLEKIYLEGLRPMRRQYVHLSDDAETAMSVGSRHAASPIVLRVNAHDAWRDGIRFERRDTHVWVSEPIPPQYIEPQD